MATEAKLGLDPKEWVGEMGNRVEANIVNGEPFIVEEQDRRVLREVIEGFGVDTKPFGRGEVVRGELRVTNDHCEAGHSRENAEDKIPTLAAQAEFVRAALGEERMVSMVVGSVSRMLPDVPDGMIEEFMVRQMAAERFKFSPGSQSGGDELVKKMIYRVEAVISSVWRMLHVLSLEEDELGEVQGDKYTLEFLRERVLRGYERENKKIGGQQNRSEKKIIRHLPPGGLRIIFEELAS